MSPVFFPARCKLVLRADLCAKTELKKHRENAPDARTCELSRCLFRVPAGPRRQQPRLSETEPNASSFGHLKAPQRSQAHGHSGNERYCTGLLAGAVLLALLCNRCTGEEPMFFGLLLFCNSCSAPRLLALWLCFPLRLHAVVV